MAYDRMILHSELLSAAKKVHASVQKKIYYSDIGKICLHLSEEMVELNYRPYPYTCFVVKDPVPREILAPHFRDRIVHRWIVDKMEPYVEPRFLACSYANRKGKGHHAAMQQLYHWLNNTELQWYLKMDIESFFNSIHHDTLLVLLQRWIERLRVSDLEKKLLQQVCAVIVRHNPTRDCVFTGDITMHRLIPAHKSYFHNKPGVGLPLGNLTSQFFANIYLHELDWYVKHRLGVRYYIRYVDDMVLLCEDKEQLKIWRDRIQEFLWGRLHLHLHPQKQRIQRVVNGIDFVGYYIKPTHILVRQRVVHQSKQKIERWIKGLKSQNKVEQRRALSSVNAYYGIFRWADAYRLGLKLFEKIRKAVGNRIERRLEGSKMKVVLQKYRYRDYRSRRLVWGVRDEYAVFQGSDTKIQK